MCQLVEEMGPSGAKAAQLEMRYIYSFRRCSCFRGNLATLAVVMNRRIVFLLGYAEVAVTTRTQCNFQPEQGSGLSTTTGTVLFQENKAAHPARRRQLGLN